MIGMTLDNDLDPFNLKRSFIFGGSEYASSYWRTAVTPRLYSGAPPTPYQIPIGTHSTGTVNHIGFIGDDDAQGGTDSAFSSIRLYEP